MSKKKEEDEENQILAHYKKFIGQGPVYFGDVDEADGSLLEWERDAEEAGMFTTFLYYVSLWNRDLDWEEAYLHIRTALGLPADEDPPDMPQWHVSQQGSTPHAPVPNQPSTKRKTRDDGSGEADAEVVDTDDPKRAKILTADSEVSASNDTMSPDDAARAAAAFIPFLTPDDLTPPKLPSRSEMEEVLLALRKKALMSEYFGGSGEAVDA